MNEKKVTSSTPLEHYYLPPELWDEILPRLPAKTLIRFRSVCKSWCSIVDSSDFIHMHRKLYPNNAAKTHLILQETPQQERSNSIITVRRRDTLIKTDQLGEISRSFYRVHNSSMVHGLMLIKQEHELRLWNPSIRKSIVLPYCPFLGFAHFVGKLGYAPSSNDYKVVAINYASDFEIEIAVVMIYSVKEHRWRLVPNTSNVPRDWYDHITDYSRGTVFFQGAVYWKPTHDSSKLVCFDFDSEEFFCLKLPDMEVGMFRFLFLLGGSLAVFGVGEVRSCIWVMQKNDGKALWRHHWSGDTCLDVYKVLAHQLSYVDHSILHFEDTGKLMIRSRDKLIAYNYKSGETHYLEISDVAISLRFVENYVESLVLHKA